MANLCDLSTVTNAEWAAWVQAIGSVAAIVAAALIARHQAKLQHSSALRLHKAERASAQTEMAVTLSVLASNSAKAMKFVADRLKDRESVHRAAEGLIHCDLGELYRLDKYVSEIPLQAVPHSLITQTMILGSTVRQFKEKVQMALDHYRTMDGAVFEDFFRTLAAMNTSIDATCKDFAKEVKACEERQRAFEAT